MKTPPFKALLALVLLFGAAQVRAQTYSIDRFEVAGGGGTSTGGVYTVSGTFGQPDAGEPMNGVGYSVVSGFWSLYASVGPAFIVEPVNTTISSGDSVVLSVSMSGTPPFSYQWYFDGAPLSDGTNATLTLTNFSQADAGTYDVAVSNAAGGVVSAPFTLSLPAYSVDWFKMAGGGGTSTGDVYTVSGTFGQQEAGGPMEGGGSAVVGGFWSLFAVQTASLTGNAPVIISQPQSVGFTNGAPASFTVSVSGTPPLFYQWQKNGVNLTDGGNLSGSTTSNLTWSALAPSDGGYYNYSVVIENAYGGVTSSSASFTGTAPAITSQPQSQIITNGSPAAFSVSASGTAPLSYQWQKNGVNLTDGGSISGSTTPTLALSSATIFTGETGSYSVIIENPYGSVTSSVAKLTLLFTLNNDLITFDEFPSYGGAPGDPGFVYGTTITDGYYGLGWNNFLAIDGAGWTYNYDAGYWFYYPNGLTAGTISLYNVAYGGYGLSSITSPNPFNFNSAYLTAGWDDNLQVEVKGFRSGVVVYDNSYTMSATAPSLLNFNYSGVTEVDFISTGGTPHGYDLGRYGGSISDVSGQEFAMDNVQIATISDVSFLPKLQMLIMSGGNFSFSWNTVTAYPAVGYQVQYTTNLASSNWINLGGVLTGTGPTLSATDTNPTDAQRFYRVLLVQ